MSLPPRSNVHQTLQNKASRSFQVQDSEPRPVRVRFAVRIGGSGESRLIGQNAIQFGALMLEEPSMSFGLIATSTIPEGSVPQGTAIVLRYLKNANGLYTGAEMGFNVYSSDPSIIVRFSLTFEAAALRSAVGHDGLLGNPTQGQNTYQGQS